MKQLHLLILTLVAACYVCKSQNKPVQPVRTPEFVKGQDLYNLDRDSSFYYFNLATNTATDSQEIAIAYNYMGIIQLEAGDYFGSQESLLEALKHLDEKNDTHHYSLSSVYTMLGNNYLNLKVYDAAISYYDEALKFDAGENLKLFALNNKAVALQKKGNYTEAIKIYSLIIDKRQTDKKEFARILSNVARAKWLRDSTYPALPELLTALHIRQEEKDNWGLNASYAHLSDFHTDSRPDSALIYAGKMYAIAQELESPDDKLEALQKLIKLSPPKALPYYINVYQELNDSILTARNRAKNQFAVIRYESEKSKADNLALQKDNAENRVQIIKQRITLYSIISVVIVGAVMAVNWYRRRKRQIERESQLKLSRKVHDVVANGIYGVMKSIEHEPGVKVDQLVDRLEILYEQSRDISYEKPEIPFKGFQLTITDLVRSFAGPSTKVLVVGNKNELWVEVPDSIKKELEPVLQELMVNMKKHSQARSVILKFDRQGQNITIRYKDDGVGLPASIKFGNGLTNTENRIKNIGGQITFDRSTMNGLSILITVPIV